MAADLASAARVDYFAAISHAVAARVRKYYRREAEVIFPPVDVAGARPGTNIADYYLIVGQLVGYKRVDLAIEACNRLGRTLRIVGMGEEYSRLRRMAGPTVSFLGSLSDEEVRKQYASCRALLFPGEEDFGIVPLEAHAAGRPVIAFGKGGVQDTVIACDFDETPFPERSTGLFFREQTAEAVADAIRMFESVEGRYSPSFIRTHAEQFDKRHFLEKMRDFLMGKLDDFSLTAPSTEKAGARNS